MDTPPLLQHVRSEIALARDTVRARRETFRERLRLYANTHRDSEKITDNTIYGLVQAYLAVVYTDEIGVTFSGRTLAESEYADRLGDLARFDYSEMRLSRINFQKEWDRIFFGVGIRVKTGWDSVRKVPVWTVKDPLSWLPDPRGNHIDPFRFHYFEEEMDTEAMIPERGYDPNTVLGLTEERQRDALDSLIEVCHGYTEMNGRRYSLTTDRDAIRMLRCVELTPDERGEYEHLVNISYFSPFRGDPYGVSLVDIVEDKQRANSILMNLRLIDAKFSTFGQMNLFDSRAVNKNDIATPSLATKWIPFDSGAGVPISQAIYPVPRQSILEDSFRVSDEIRRRIELDTGMDSRMLGAEGATNLTLGEVNQLQANANLRLALGIEISNWGEREFWEEWYRSYRRYFSCYEVKTIRIPARYSGTRMTTLGRDDIVRDESPDIIVENRRRRLAETATERTEFSDRLPLLLSEKNLPEITRRYALRKALKLDGISTDEIGLLVPPTPDEADAESIVRLLTMNQLPDGLVERIASRDALTYYLAFQRCPDTNARTQALDIARVALSETQAV